ncbi:hypothetical protein T05_12951 [Trichinella murrelli]|uniref:Uncharacterized protein n=1 Tax=Trichinella murrelli TaxID=144512 RepID=A0A0V0T9F9_9BILA|nr:hypothetical protein T05_12951 [Trichinella murrelli]
MWLSGECGQLLRFLECDCAEHPAVVSCLRDLVLPRFGTAHHGKSLPGLAATTCFITWHKFRMPSEATFFPFPTVSCRSIWNFCCYRLMSSLVLGTMEATCTVLPIHVHYFI